MKGESLIEGIPVIRIELERMRQTLLVAINQQFASMDQDVKAAVAKVCTPDTVRKIIEQHASTELEAAIREEVSKFFRWGNGRKAVAEAVSKILEVQQ